MSIYIPGAKRVNSIFASIPFMRVREFALYGKAKQNTTSGKNLLDNKATSQTVNGVTFTVNDDKSITINGTATASIGNYYLNQENMNLDNMIATCEGINGLSGIYFAINNGITTFNVFGSKKEVSLSGVMSYARIYVDSGATFNNVTIYPMIRLASITDDTYEPFTNGASPNPQYPQPIEVSGESGSVTVKSIGKNLVSDDWEQGILSVDNGTSISSNGYWIHTNKYVEVDSTKQYTISGDTTSSATIYLYDENKSFLTTLQPLRYAGTPSKTITIVEKTKYVRFGYNYNGSAEKITPEQMGVLHWLQLEEGEVATPYEPYKETLATIPTENGLAGIKVSSNGNYTDQNGQQWICDEVVKYADGSGEKIQRIGKAVFDGSDDEEWMLSTANVGNQFAINISNNGSRYFLCTHFRNSGVNNWGNVPNLTYMVHPTVFKTVRFRYDACTTVDEWKANLQANPMTVYYELAEPITTPLTAEEIAEIEKLSAVYPANNISISDDCGMKLNFDQYYETKKIVSAWANKDGVPAKVFNSASEITAFKGMVILSGNDLSYKLPIEIPLNSELIESPTGSGGIISSVAFGYTSTLLTLTDKAIKKYKYIDVGLVTNSVTTVCNYRNNSTLEMVSRTVKPNVHVQGELVDGKVKISGKTISIIAEPPTYDGFTYVNTLQPQVSSVAVSSIVLYS